MGTNTLSLFTKPWRELPLRQLGTLVCRLGFQAIELPIRPGYQVPPERAGTLLPDAVRILAESGISVASVASTPEHGIVDACARAGVPLIRDMARVLPGERYTDAEIRLRAEYARLGPALASAGVRLGIQNHAGSFVPNALGLRALLSDLDPAVFVAVWDAAHEALAGIGSAVRAGCHRAASGDGKSEERVLATQGRLRRHRAGLGGCLDGRAGRPGPLG